MFVHPVQEQVQICETQVEGGSPELDLTPTRDEI